MSCKCDCHPQARYSMQPIAHLSTTTTFNVFFPMLIILHLIYCINEIHQLQVRMYKCQRPLQTCTCS